VWTVDDSDEVARLIAWAVDGICTNFPDRARRVVDATRAA
jgi:glycerophosphoryl diester phosphodiesterase